MMLFLLSLTCLCNTVCKCSEGPLLCLWCLQILINFIQFLFLKDTTFLFFFLFLVFIFFFFFFWNLPSVLFEILFIILTNQWLLSCGIYSIGGVNPSTNEQVSVWFCFLKFLNIFKEPSFLQNLVFALVEVNVVAASNSDANSKKVRHRQGFVFQESVPRLKL